MSKIAATEIGTLPGILSISGLDHVRNKRQNLNLPPMIEVLFLGPALDHMEWKRTSRQKYYNYYQIITKS